MGEMRVVPCPMCGRVAGQKVIRRADSTYIKVGSSNFWLSTLKFDPDKPFGVIMESTGRGTLHKVGTFDPQDDKEYFPLVKKRLLAVIKEWTKKGWVSQTEVAAAARGVVAETPSFSFHPQKAKTNISKPPDAVTKANREYKDTW